MANYFRLALKKVRHSDFPRDHTWWGEASCRAARKKQFERNAEIRKKLLMMASAVFAAVFGAWAETETFGGYTWTCRINGDTAENMV